MGQPWPDDIQQLEQKLYFDFNTDTVIGRAGVVGIFFVMPTRLVTCLPEPVEILQFNSQRLKDVGMDIHVYDSQIVVGLMQ